MRAPKNKSFLLNALECIVHVQTGLLDKGIQEVLQVVIIGTTQFNKQIQFFRDWDFLSCALIQLDFT
jgi:hypothetical protein